MPSLPVWIWLLSVVVLAPLVITQGGFIPNLALRLAIFSAVPLAAREQQRRERDGTPTVSIGCSLLVALLLAAVMFAVGGAILGAVENGE
jgi:hypothetical protein